MEITKEEYDSGNGMCEQCDTDILSEEGEEFEDLF